MHLGRGNVPIKDARQLELENFYLPFGGHLNPDNRLVELARLIPWAEFEEKYAVHFAEPHLGGITAKPFRMALGALLIKEKLGASDRETVQQIRENHYLQYLIGLESYRDEDPFIVDPAKYRRLLEGAKESEIERIPIEGKFGNGKRKYGWSKIVSKLKSTTE